MWFKHALSRKLFAFLWAGTAVLVISLALLVSVARLMLPLLDEYRLELEQIASDQVGRPVKIGEISAGWQGLHPDLRFHDVRILTADGGDTWLAMREVRASLDLIASLRERRLETGQISLVGGSLDIARHSDGSFSVAGVATGFGGVAGHGGRRLLEWMMGRERVSLEDATLRWRDARLSSEPLLISDLSLDLHRVDGQYHLGGAGQLAGAPQGALRFALQLSGDPRQPETLRSSAYLDGRVMLGDWLDGSAFAGVERVAGTAAFELWADGADRLERLRGIVQGRDLVWQPQIAVSEGGPVTAVRFDQASGNLFWRRQADGWRLALEQVQVVRDAKPWPRTRLQLAAGRTATGARSWELAAPFLRLEDLNALLVTVPGLDAAVRRAALDLAPAGDLRQLAVRYQPGSEGLYAAARFDGLSVRSWARLPGISGIDGVLRLRGKHGYLSLDSKQVSFIYPRLFREPLQARQLSGQLYWYPGPDGLRLYAPQFAAANDDVGARGRLRMDFPGAGASPFMDLQVDFHDGHGAQAPRYLPTGIMPPELVQWLDRALVGGRVAAGRLLYFGRLADFPYTADNGTFRVDFGVEDLILDYAPGWPRLEQARATVQFSDRSLRAQVDVGKMLGLTVGRGHVAIDELSRRAVLELDTGARGPLADFFTYLRRGPLAEDPPALLEQLETGGPAAAHVRLRLPLRDAERARVEGRVEFADNLLAWPQWQARFEQLRGALDFRYRVGGASYDAEGLSLRWHGAPATASVRTSDVGTETQVQMNLETRNEAATLMGDRAAALGDVLQGVADWKFRATLRQSKDGSAAPEVDLQAQSDLRGAAVRLPAPLEKAADTERSLLVQASLGAEGVGSVRLYYGALLNGVFGFEDGKLQRGELRFGTAQAGLPAEPGLRIAGQIERLALRPWRHWFEEAMPGGEGTDQWRATLSEIELRIGVLEAMGYQVSDLQLAARPEAGEWLAQLSAPEIAGEVRIPLGGAAPDAPLVARLQRLHLRDVGGVDADARDSDFDPTSLPPLRVEVQDFSYGDTALGKLELSADPVADGLRVDRAHMETPYFSATAHGQWRTEARGEVSDFAIDAHTSDLGRALEASGYAGTIEGGTAGFQIEAQWPGSPADFALKDLDGKLSVLIKDGQLLELDPRAGRIFGLLSLQALPRRLSLDFSDLVQRGFGFDRIQGSFTIAGGDAYTNDLYMEGPAARVDVAGRIGLAAEDYDQSALVTPRLSASIPVVGGLAGGPAVGLGLWVAERMFGRKIDELSRVRYNITGPWRDPVVTRVDDAG